jgi:hypothetical protein
MNAKSHIGSLIGETELYKLLEGAPIVTWISPFGYRANVSSAYLGHNSIITNTTNTISF